MATYNPITSELEKCAICLDDNKNNLVKMTVCCGSQIVHKQCMDEHYNRNGTKCLICKNNISSGVLVNTSKVNYTNCILLTFKMIGICVGALILIAFVIGPIVVTLLGSLHQWLACLVIYDTLIFIPLQVLGMRDIYEYINSELRNKLLFYVTFFVTGIIITTMGIILSHMIFVIGYFKAWTPNTIIIYYWCIIGITYTPLLINWIIYKLVSANTYRTYEVNSSYVEEVV